MLWALIMAGGQGTRLWPLSNRILPKPFLRIIPGKKSLIEETINRLSPLIPKSRIFIIGNEEQLPLLRKAAAGIPTYQIIGEPTGRNTAPTVALAAKLIAQKDPRGVLLTLPADHWIGNKSRFQAAIKQASQFSGHPENYVIFGVKPTFPSPSYGYLLRGKKISSSIYELKRFIEKPSAQKAKRFLASRQYLWHAGIFLAPVMTILASIAKYQPRLAKGLNAIDVKAGKISLKAFQALPKISIDYAVLERLKTAAVLEGTFDWCDVGTWSSLGGLWAKDGLKNAAFEPCHAFDAKENIVFAKNKTVCLYGVNDLVVIDTPSALFVGKKNLAEEMRGIGGKISK